MAAVTAPVTGRSLLGKLASAVAARRAAHPERLLAVAAKIREHAATAAACAAADLGGFQVFHHGGWFVLAASVIFLHFDVSG